MSASVLQLIGVRKRFGDTEVLRGIDLEVDRHEVVALIGSSGSGKSTLLRTVNLLERIDDGQILLGGEDISDPRVDADRVRARVSTMASTLHSSRYPTPRIVKKTGLSHAWRNAPSGTPCCHGYSSGAPSSTGRNRMHVSGSQRAARSSGPRMVSPHAPPVSWCSQTFASPSSSAPATNHQAAR